MAQAMPPDRAAADTIALNRERHRFDNRERIWLFGYGSLIFKADFDYLERVPASIHGWSRRFWQASHDHRGTPERPGRVVTLTAQAGAVCRGMAYLIAPGVLTHLDHREKNGYLRLSERIYFDRGGSETGLVYIADAANAAYLGPAPEHEIAQQIATAAGPSGANRDYAIGLAQALRPLVRAEEEDRHVFTIARLLAGGDFSGVSGERA